MAFWPQDEWNKNNQSYIALGNKRTLKECHVTTTDVPNLKLIGLIKVPEFAIRIK